MRPPFFPTPARILAVLSLLAACERPAPAPLISPDAGISGETRDAGMASAVESPKLEGPARLAELGCFEGCCAGEPTCRSYYYTPAYREDLDTIRLTALDLAKLGPGMSAADIGAGSGFIAGRAAHLVMPRGTVWATDIDPRAIRALAGATGGERLSSLRIKLVKHPRDTGLDRLPPRSLSAMFLINSVNFGRRGDPAADLAYLKRLGRLLVRGGRLIYHTDWLDGDLLSKAELTDLFQRAGFHPPTEVPLPARLPAETCYCDDTRTARLAHPGYLLVFEHP